MFKEFKEFALKGNLIDIAVGLVMATAFTSIVTSFVDGMFMPLVAKIFQLGDYKEAKIVLDEAVLSTEGKVIKPENAIFMVTFSAIINFVIIAFFMFSIVKLMNSMKKKKLLPLQAPHPKVY